MTDVINLYPKTSCMCWTCEKEYPVQQKGVKSNLAFKGCRTPQYFDCYNAVELKEEQQPRSEKGWVTLNPQAYTNKIGEGFYPAKNVKGCPEKGWLNADPRQYDTLRAERLVIDRPSTDGNVRLEDVYNEKYDGYGIGFRPYEAIGDGDITYYIDRSISDAFYKPVYSEPAKARTTLYQDPMGGMRPQYERTPLVNTQNPTVTTPTRYPYSLSWMQDSQSYREDLMSWQQRKHNESKWSARWARNTE